MENNTSTSELKQLARSIIEYEHAAGKSAAKGSALPRAHEKLAGPLCKSAGVQGFRSLLNRSLALAVEEFPGLQGLKINADGSLDGLEELKTKFNAKVATQAETILLAQLLGLLMTFFGPKLTLHLLLETWPATKVDFYEEHPWLLAGSSGRENQAVAGGPSRSPTFSTKSMAWTPSARTSGTVMA